MNERIHKRKSLRPKRVEKYGLQLILGLILVELVSLGYMYYQGAGFLFLQTLIVLIPVSAVSCFLVLRYQANRYLVIVTFLLLNFGFVAQYFTSDDPSAIISGTLRKYLIAFAAAYLAAILFYQLSWLLSLDAMIPLITLIQFVLCTALFVFGQAVGDTKGQGAVLGLSIGGIYLQPMELVKVMYVFVVVSLLCKEERKERRVLGLPRDIYLILYTILFACFALILSEMGTFLIMLLIGGGMMLTYSRNRKGVLLAGMAAGAAMSLGWAACVLLKDHIGVCKKVYLRIVYFLNPELDPLGEGYQMLQARKALTIGGILGPDTERYLVGVPRANDDMIFANLVQRAGVIVGILMIFAVFAIFYQGVQIGQKCRDSYYSGLAVGIALLFAAEALVHIGYNVGLLPITGIPLYLVSEGVTSMTTGLAMIAVLLVISTEALPERKSRNEETYERKCKKMVRNLLPGRRRIQRKERK